MTALVLIWGPLYIVLTALVFFAVKHGGRLITDSRWPHRLVLMAAISWPVGDFALANLIIFQKCFEDGGSHLYEVAENVDGYFDAQGQGCDGACVSSLIDRDGPKFSFIEAHASEERISRIFSRPGDVGNEMFERVLVPGPGLYRFALEEVGHPNCALYSALYKKRTNGRSESYFQNKCVATTPIVGVTARYKTSSIYTEENMFFGQIRTLINSVEKLSDGAVMLERRLYVFVSNTFWSSFLGPLSCKKADPFLTHLDVLKTVSGDSGNHLGVEK